MKYTRRQTLQAALGGAAALLASAGVPFSLAAAETKRIPIALELWSVRLLAARDLAKVLAATAQMGYQGIEVAHSYYGHDAATWKKLLADNGLQCCGMHTTLPKIEGAMFQKTVDFHKTLGNKTLILASLPHNNTASEKILLDTAKQLNELAAKFKEQGMRLGYHCHAGDFKPIAGKTPWEILGANTNSDFIMQIDVGNCRDGGGDPLAMIRKFPGRAVTVHLKEHGANVIGEGDIPWLAVFEACETVGGATWYIVEEESGNADTSLGLVKRSLDNLRKMGK